MKISYWVILCGGLFEFLRHHPICRYFDSLFFGSCNHIEQQSLYFALMSFCHVFLHGGGAFGGEFVYYFEVILYYIFLEFDTQLLAQSRAFL